MSQTLRENPESYLSIRNGEVSAYVGPDATKAFAALTIASAIDLWCKTKMQVCRGVGIRKMLRRATEITGKPYSTPRAEEAAKDLRVWAREMKAALPHEHR